MTERRLEVRFQTAMHHGCGFGIAGLVDRGILRDSSGLPYLAGSSIKGRLRHAALRLLVTEGEPVCRYADQKAVCREEACGLCALFGSPWRSGRLRFSDAYPSGEMRLLLETLAETSKGGILHRDSAVRAATAIDRRLGKARENHLFTTEALPDAVAFEGRILGDLDESGEQLLKNAATILTHFGADAARGLGQCEFQIKRLA